MGTWAIAGKFTNEAIISFVSFTIKLAILSLNLFKNLVETIVWGKKTLADELKKVEGALKLGNLSKTRWVGRTESVNAVKLGYKQMAFENSPLFDASTKRMISNLQINIFSGKFVVSLFFMKEVLIKTEFFTEALWKEKLNIIEAVTLFGSAVSNLRDMNNKREDVWNSIRKTLNFVESLDKNFYIGELQRFM